MAPSPAQADASSEAKAAYDAGTVAFEQGDYPEAARAFARADALNPHPVALESALKAAILADQPVFAMTLADRARERPAHDGLERQVARAEQEFGHRVGQLAVLCPDARPCEAFHEQAQVEPGELRRVAIGEHSVVVQIDGDRRSFEVRVMARDSVRFRPVWEQDAGVASAPAPPYIAPSDPPPLLAPVPEPAPTPAPESDSQGGGVSPVWFWIPAVGTVISAGVTTAFGVETLGLNEDFQGGDDTALEPGQDAQLRTNVMIGVTAGLAAASAILGFFVVDWGSGEAQVGVGPTSATVAVRF